MNSFERTASHLRSDVYCAAAGVRGVRLLSSEDEDGNHSLVVHQELPHHAAVLLQRLVAAHERALHLVEVRLDVLGVVDLWRSEATSSFRMFVC